MNIVVRTEFVFGFDYRKDNKIEISIPTHSVVHSRREGWCPHFFRRSATLSLQNYCTVHWRTFLKDLQFPFRNRELREAAMQTHHQLRKDPHDGFVQTFESGEMDGNFAIKHALLIGMANFAGHGEPPGKLSLFYARAGSHVRLFKLDHSPLDAP
jgi:hypothetical protein